MKNLAYFLIICAILGGCTRKTSTEIAFDAVDKSITSLEKTLPAECKTDVVLAQVATVRADAETARLVCQSDIKAIKIKYERALIALWVVMLVFLASIFVKK